MSGLLPTSPARHAAGLPRRDFLRLAAGGVTGALLLPHLTAGGLWADEGVTTPSGGAAASGSVEAPTLGRAILPGLHVHPEPRVSAPDIRFLGANEVVPIMEVVRGDAWLSHNPDWYRLEEGFVYSSWVQPVRDEPQPPQEVGSEGWWGEVSVPYVVARSRPGPEAPRVYVLPFATTYAVREAAVGSDGEVWYRVHDEQKGWPEWVPSPAIRRLTAQDFAPIRAEVPDKLIDIDLTRFRITALEDGQPILVAPIATGAPFKVRGTLVDFRTPPGWHRVLWKRPSRHMIGGTEGESDYFDLPGVPWVTYFTWTGAAIHGTYWHNDYGRQRSHGCVNVTPEVGRFFYRWTMPVAPYEAAVHWSRPGEGTRIFVHP